MVILELELKMIILLQLLKPFITFKIYLFILLKTLHGYVFLFTIICIIIGFFQVPIQSSLVDFSLLTDKQQKWLTWYNNQCMEKVSPFLTSTLATNYLKKCLG